MYLNKRNIYVCIQKKYIKPNNAKLYIHWNPKIYKMCSQKSVSCYYRLLWQVRLKC